MKIRSHQFFFIGVVVTFIVFGSLLALWDVARHQRELNTGFYDLPFGIPVPWNIAGDLFVLLGLCGFLTLVFIIIVFMKAEARLKGRGKVIAP